MTVQYLSRGSRRYPQSTLKNVFSSKREGAEMLGKLIPDFKVNFIEGGKYHNT